MATVVRMTDAQVLHEFLQREQRWLHTLQALRSFHETEMGKVTTAVQWVGGRELGRLSWLGYYWHREMFWFGYGLHGAQWRPMIEADNRSRFAEVWQSMRHQLSGNWEAASAEGSLYLRLWSPDGIGGSSESETEWFKSRSRELHEYVVQPEL